MRIKIRTKGVRLYLPIPMSLAKAVLRLTPEKVFENIRMKIPESYANLITKENVSMIVRECMEIKRESRGLEVVRVEAEDGTIVSIRL